MRSLAILLLTVAPSLAQTVPPDPGQGLLQTPAQSGAPDAAADLPPGLIAAELMPGWITDDGQRMTALRLTLEPGWKTYWRSPGDAGVPPRFDWQGSDNLGAVQMLWPRPEVIDSGGERTLGYHDELVLPIRIAPVDAGAPIHPVATVDFGLCLDICVPAQVALRAPPPGGAPDPLIQSALDRQPRRSSEQPDCRIAAISDGMQVTATLPASHGLPGDDVAMELTEDDIWVSAPDMGRDGSRLTAQADFVAASGKPFVLDPGSLRLTVISADDAVEYAGCRQLAD